MFVVDRIEELILKDSEDFFDYPESRSDLHVTIRIAADFHEFLMKWGEAPPPREIDYVMGTVRSGMDQFFSLAYSCRTIDTSPATWNFDRQIHWNFGEMRQAFLNGFAALTKSESSWAERLATLLALTHLELVFLAHYFPWMDQL